MHPGHCSNIFERASAYWNWKCALLSATARSLVYLAAAARVGSRGRLSIVLVEIAYVLLTAGLYAGLQQKALGFRSRVAGNLTIVVGVPGLAQMLDWLAHRAAQAAAPPRATLAVCVFAAISALFHLYVMRKGVFLTGNTGRSFASDLRRVPGLIAGLAIKPVVFWAEIQKRFSQTVESDAAL
jgi:hypothetical protein